MLDIKYNNHNLKNARIITSKYFNDSPSNSLKRASRLEGNLQERENFFSKDSYDLLPQRLKLKNKAKFSVNYMDDLSNPLKPDAFRK